MVATAADYAWFEECFPGLAEAYCLTLVRGLSPPQVLARLGARTNGPQVTGVGRLAALDLDTDEEQLIAVTVAEDGTGQAWALAVESGGRLGVSEEAIVPLSAGTLLVAHSRGADGSGRFSWAQDGDVRATFEPRVPSAFALAEQLTGLRVTPEILRVSLFQCGLAPLP